MKIERLAESRKALAFGLFVALATVMVVHTPASAQSTGVAFAVNSTGDVADASTADNKCDTDPATPNNQCTLRAAIQQANATPGADTIGFKILGSGVQTITPGSEVAFAPLPEITEAVTIDGYTQPGASPNTLEQGNDAVLRIELKGTNIFEEGLKIGDEASNVVVRGLVINDFAFDCGIDIVANTATNHRIEGNFIGTDPTGTSDLGNILGVCIGLNFNAPLVEETNNIIGGNSPDKRNVISGNDVLGVDLGRTSGNRVEGNYIGTKEDGTSALGNGGNGFGAGVFIGGATNNNTVGGTDAGAANVIAFNGGGGVEVTRVSDGSFGTGNRILGNSIFSNGELGIDLMDEPFVEGVTPNDKKDPDTGPNNLQNFPILSSATTSGGTTTIKGKLSSRPRKKFTIQFFSNPSGTDEGKTFIGQKAVTTNRKGNASFTFVPEGEVLVGDAITATATRNSTGDTSEFSEPRSVTAS